LIKQTKKTVDLSKDIVRVIRLECEGNIAAITATPSWGTQEPVTLFVEERESLRESIAELGSQMVILGMMIAELAREKA
jgi:hypothetical protein